MTRQNVALMVFLVFGFGYPVPLLAQGAENKSAGQEKVFQTLRVTAARANVRDSASMKAEVLFQIPRGDILRLLEKSGDWYWIEASDGRRGYIHQSLIEVLPPPAADTKPSEAKSGAAEAKDSSSKDKAFRNLDVIEMSLAGLSEGLIVDLVMQSAAVDFDLSAGALIELNKKGVSENIIRAMMARARGVAAPETANSIPSPNYQSKDKPQAVRPTVPTQKEYGKFGVGLSLGLSPGGAVPTVLYDVNERNSVVGMFSFVTGASALSAGLLHRFPQPSKNPDQAVTLEPFLGGGLSLVNVDYGSFFGSESFTGFFGAGGTFLRFKPYPHWRFSGTIYLIQFNLGEFDSPAVRGVGAAIGFAYFF